MAAIVLFVIAAGVRVGFAIAFFLIVVSTAHFRLGRYGELSRHFGGALLAMLVSFAAIIALSVVRIILAATRAATGKNATTFWTTPLGAVFSVMWVVHLTLTVIYYIKAASALRRASSSEHHTHPDDLRLRRRAPSAYRPSGAQLMPL